MAAGGSDRLWDVQDLVGLLEQKEVRIQPRESSQWNLPRLLVIAFKPLKTTPADKNCSPPCRLSLSCPGRCKAITVDADTTGFFASQFCFVYEVQDILQRNAIDGCLWSMSCTSYTKQKGLVKKPVVSAFALLWLYTFLGTKRQSTGREQFLSAGVVLRGSKGTTRVVEGSIANFPWAGF